MFKAVTHILVSKYKGSEDLDILEEGLLVSRSFFLGEILVNFFVAVINIPKPAQLKQGGLTD